MLNLKKILCMMMVILTLVCAYGCTPEGTQSSGGQSTGAQSTGGTTAEDDTIPEELPGYELVWQDEFRGSELDDTKWSCMIGDGTDYGIPGWGNGEAQFYTGDNVRLEGGKLIITAKKEAKGGKQYTSARLRTAGKYSVLYGRIEARISLPEVTGLWPAFWMLPEDTRYGSWPRSGEIDIMEAKGRYKYESSGALHFSKNGGHRYETDIAGMPGDTSISDYHIYAIEWTDKEIKWFVDDEMFLKLEAARWAGDVTQSGNAPFDVNFHILLNLAVGGHFDGYQVPPAGFTSAEMKVDYVRVYKPL